MQTYDKQFSAIYLNENAQKKKKKIYLTRSEKEEKHLSDKVRKEVKHLSDKVM